ARYRPAVHRADALEPWGEAAFESIAVVHLLHCLPGSSIADKVIVLEQGASALSPDGVIFGATILADPDLQTPLSPLALRAANRRGTMSNVGASRADLDDALAEHFHWHELTLRGSVALFSARR